MFPAALANIIVPSSISITNEKQEKREGSQREGRLIQGDNAEVEKSTT
jgi:hypothetical protein